MNCKHITTNERYYIANFLSLGQILRKIAKHLNRNVSTISRDVKRNSTSGKYLAHVACVNYIKNIENYGAKGNINKLRRKVKSLKHKKLNINSIQVKRLKIDPKKFKKEKLQDTDNQILLYLTIESQKLIFQLLLIEKQISNCSSYEKQKIINI